MKHISLLTACLLMALLVPAQSVTNYQFSASSGTYIPLTGGYTLPLSGGTADNGYINSIPIGFPFVYMGAVCTFASASTNGWMTIGHTITADVYTNNLSTGGTRPLIAPLWDNLDLQSVSNFSYKTTGTAPYRVFTAEWKNIQWNNTASGNTISFQVLLYETTGVIEYVYRQEAGALNGPGASIGITAQLTGSGNYLSLNNAGASPTVSSTTETTTINTKPANGQVYTFTPPAAPSAPSGLGFTSITQSGMTLGWTDNASTETGFAIFRSTDGTTYSWVTTTAADAITYAATGLLPGITYYWKVFAINEGAMSAALEGSQVTAAAGAVISAASGNWSDPATWSPAAVPTSSDNVTIADGHTVIIDAAATCNSLTVGQGSSGILRFGTTAVTMTVINGVTVSAGGIFDAGAAAGANLLHTLYLGNNYATSPGTGSLTVEGTFDMFIGLSNGKAYVTFCGNPEATVAGSGSVCDFYSNTLNKGAVTASPTIIPPVLELQRNFTVQGSATTAFLSNHGYGCLKVGGTFTQSNPLYSSATYSVPAAGGLWIANPNFTMTNTATTSGPTITGLMKITAGTVFVGTGNSTPFNLASGAVFLLEGGLLSLSGRFGTSTSGPFYYNQSGGTLRVGTVSGYTHTGNGMVDLRGCINFNMSGGTVEIQYTNANTTSTGNEWHGPEGAVNISGGTLQLGNASSGSSALTYEILNAMPTVVVYTPPSANHHVSLKGAATMYGDFTMNGTGTFSMGTTTYGLTMAGCSSSFPGNITNNGTFTMNSGTANYLAFTGSFGNQSFSNAGTITGSELPSLSVSNTSAGGMVTLPDNLTLRGGTTAITPYLNLLSGTLVANNLTLQTGTTGFTCTVTNGSLQHTPSFSFVSSPVNYTYNGTIAQVTGVELPASISGTLTINNPGGVTLNAPLSAGKLTLTTGTLTTSAVNLLTVTGTVSTDVTYTSGQVSGPLARTIPANYSTAGSYLFPLGKSAYKPLELVNPVTNAGGTVVVRAEVFDTDCGGTAGATMVSLNTDRYWVAEITSGASNFTSTQLRLTESGLTTNHGIAKSSTLNGTYELASLTGPSGSTLITDVMTSLSYYAIGIKKMNYVSSTTTQPVTTYVRQESVNNQILRMEVVTAGNNSPILVSSLTMNTNGSTSATDILAARVFYTGTSSTFSTSNQFGSDFPSTSGSFTITGSQAMAEGTNYFWLVYDISVNAGNNNLVDGEFNSITIGGVAKTPTVQAPTGNRPVKAALEGTVTVGSGGTFASLTLAGGLFEYINQAGLRGNTTVQIISDLTAETGLNALDQWIEVGGDTFSLTIQPDAAILRTISGIRTGGLIRLNGTDRVTIDGRYGGSGMYLDIRNLSTNTSTQLCPVHIISLGTGAGATDNTIRNCYLSNNHNGSNTSGISVCGATANSSTGDDNDNTTITGCTISKAYWGIYARGSASGYLNNLVISGNTIGSDVADDYISKYGILIWHADGARISDNTVFNIKNSTGQVYGLYLYTGVINSMIQRNSIHGLAYTGTSSYGALGILLGPGTNTTCNDTVANNLIYDLTGTGSPGTGTNISGIVLGYSNGNAPGIRVFYNSINLYGNISRAAATQDRSAAVYIYMGVSDLILKNNILSNTIENTTGTAKAHAIYTGTAAWAFTTINNNIYFVDGPEAVLGFISSDRNNLTEWRTATGQDIASLDGDPMFATAADLRCDFSSPAFLAGNPVSGIADDFLGVIRNVVTPTIGAYENGLDARGPSFSYTPLGNTSVTGDRTLSVAMTDHTGIPTSGSGLPVLYWRINQGTWTGATATYVSPGQYTFTFGSGVATNDSVYYYIVAQDLYTPPNVSITPAAGASGFLTDPPAVTTPPSAPHSYRIAVALTGSVNVGTGETYTNLTGASGIFRMINENVVTGNLAVNITSDLTEDGTYGISQWFEEGGSGFTVTIQSSGTTERLIQGDIAQGMIRLDGADRVTFDGRSGGSGRYLKFRNINTAGKTFYLLNDATGNTIRNCTIEGSALGSANAVIQFGSTAGTTGNDNNTILENVIRDRSDAAGVPTQLIYSSGSTVNYTRSNSGNTISDNEIFNFVGYGVCLSTGNSTGWTISGNHFYNTLSTPPAISQYAIYINSGIYPHSYVVNNNNIGGSEASCGGNAWENTTTGTFCGIYVNADWDDPSSIQGNTITNIRMTNTSAGNFYGIWVADGEAHIGTTTGNQIGSSDTSRTIRNNSGINARIYGIYVNSDNYNQRVENSIIRNLILTGMGTAGYPRLAGIYVYSADCRNNIITGLTTTQTSLEPYIYGIYSYGLPGAYDEISNNVIALDGGASANPEIAGFYENSYASCSYSFIYNSIILTGKATSWWTYAFYSEMSATYDIRNNTIINTRGNDGSNLVYGIYFADAGTVSSDYNDIWCPEGYAGYLNDNYGSLVSWRQATGLDLHSVSEDPVFADPKSDLRPDMSSPLLAAGIPDLDVDTDIEGNPRSLTAPTIGAYENGGDYRGPLIVFTPLKNTTSTASRTLTATITDYTGVPVSGTGLPVLYWRLNTGSWTAQTAVSLGGDLYQFTFGGGGATGDSVSYFIAAQDTQIPPYVSLKPDAGAAGLTSDPPACSTPPASPYQYWIGNPLNGIIPVGTAETYLNLTGNTGLFRLINRNVVVGDITASITSNLTEEGIHALNNWAEEGTGGYTLTIRPAASVSPVVTGSVGNGLIRFTGTDRVVIDGSNNGTDSRNLTFSNTSSADDPYIIHFGSVVSQTFRDIVVKNCILTGNDQASTTGGAGLVFSGFTSSIDTGYFDNITVENNLFQKSYFGLYFRGGFSPSRGSDVYVLDNIMDSSGTLALKYVGIYLQGVNGGTVSGNRIGNLDQANWQADKGIWIAEGCTGIQVDGNRIHQLGYSGVSGNAAQGILVTTVRSAADIRIFNNLIEGITGDGVGYTSAGGLYQNPVGILAYAAQSGISIHFNTISLYGNTLNKANALSGGIFLGMNTVADIRDNIISNTLGPVTTLGYGACGVYAEQDSLQFAASDYNDYYISLYGSGVAAIGKIGTTITATTLTEWQTATGQDTHSLNEDPLFVSLTDLHPEEPLLDGAGTGIAGITADYDGILRGTPPDIGAYEFSLAGAKTWDGSLSSDWNSDDNWTPAGVPVASDNVIIPSGTPHACIVNTTGLTCRDIVLYNGSTVTVDGAAVITINGNLTIQNGATLTNGGTIYLKGNLDNQNTN